MRPLMCKVSGYSLEIQLPVRMRQESIEFKLSSIKIIVFNHSSCLPEYSFPHFYRVRNNSCGTLDEEKWKFLIDPKTHPAWNECTIAYSIEWRSFNNTVECVIFILPLVELQMSLECSTSIFLRTFNHRLITRFSKLKSFFIRYNFSYRRSVCINSISHVFSTSSSYHRRATWIR